MTELSEPMVIETTIKLKIIVTKIGATIPDEDLEDFKDWVRAKVSDDITTGYREEYRLGDEPEDDFPVEMEVILR